MATPLTAGAAALLYAAKPGATVAEVRWACEVKVNYKGRRGDAA